MFQINTCDRKVQSQEITIAIRAAAGTVCPGGLARGSAFPHPPGDAGGVRIFFDPLVFQTQRHGDDSGVSDHRRGVNVIPDVTPATSGINGADHSRAGEQSRWRSARER